LRFIPVLNLSPRLPVRRRGGVSGSGTVGGGEGGEGVARGNQHQGALLRNRAHGTPASGGGGVEKYGCTRSQVQLPKVYLVVCLICRCRYWVGMLRRG